MNHIKRFEEYTKDLHESFVPEIPKKYENEKEIAGLKEVIEIEGLGKMKVKLDSGNTAMNALIVQDYYEDKDEHTVKFDFNGEEKKFDVVKHIRIWHHGKSTERPVIKVNIKFNGKVYEDELIDLKISDLTGTKNYRSRLLLCKDFMAKAKIVIDPSKEFKLTDKKELPKKKKKKVNESVWGDVRRRADGDVTRKENEIGNISDIVPVDLGGSVLWADRDLELKDGTCYFDIDFAQNLGEVNGWRIPTLEEAKELKRLRDKNMCYSEKEQFVIKNGETYLYLPKKGCLDSHGKLDYDFEYIAWSSDFKYAQSFGFMDDGADELGGFEVVKYRIHINKHDFQFCIRLVKDK